MTVVTCVVPDPILYELLSLPQNADSELFPFSSIQLDPMFICLQTKFICYHSMGNVKSMVEMLTLMGMFVTESTFTTKTSCVCLNMIAYCRINVGHHWQSVKSILQSCTYFTIEVYYCIRVHENRSSNSTKVTILCPYRIVNFQSSEYDI